CGAMNGTRGVSDVRLTGFAERAPLAQAWAWLDAACIAPGQEMLPPEDAAGRVLTADVAAHGDLPSGAVAAVDGYAVRAADTEGASAYNPLPLILSAAAGTGRACRVAAGATLPLGSDAILTFDAATCATPAKLEVLEPVAQGDGVAPRGSLARSGAVALAAGRRLRPQDLGLLRMLGVMRVPVLRRPPVRLVVAGPKGSQPEALGPMLRALVARDGGMPVAAGGATLATAIAASDQAGVILVAGRSSAGEDDLAAAALVEAGGAVAMHGIALRPGGSSGLGRLGAVPVLLLPGEPLACLAAYELLAGRLIRQIAGFPAALPHPTREFALGRKIVSAIGFTDMVQVAIAGGLAAPIGSVEGGGLPASCRAAGFVVVPERREGHAEGETVRVHLYEPA
ncbi:MAG: molybdopterin-binding protein, partial [Acetobacteraceae bacterium]